MEMESRLLGEESAKSMGYGTVNTAFDSRLRSRGDLVSDSDLSTTTPSLESSETSVSDKPMLFPYPLRSEYNYRSLDRLTLTGLTPYNWNGILNSDNPNVIKAALKSLRELPIPLSMRVTRANHLRCKLDSRRQLPCKSCCACVWSWLKSMFSVRLLDCFDRYIRHIEGIFGKGVGVYFSLLKFFLWLNLQLVFITVVLVVLPQLFFNYASLFDSTQSGWDAFRWSLFFYGFYQNVINAEVFAVANLYFVATCKNFLSAFKSVVSGISDTYRRQKQNVVTGSCLYSELIFCGWEYTRFHKEAARCHHVTFTKQLTRMIDKEYAYITGHNGRCLHTRRVVTNIAYVGVLLLGCYVVNRCAYSASGRGQTVAQDFSVMETNQLAIVVAVIKNVIPWLISFLSYIEKWQKPAGDYACIIRSVLCTSLFLTVLDFSLVSYFSERELSNLNGTVYCWETEVGMEYFRIFGFDLLFGFIIILFTDVALAIIVGRGFMRKIISYREFDVFWALNDLIFTQTLLWLAVYFSPLLPILGMAKFVILFAFRYSSANLTNALPSNIMSPPRSGKTVYMSLVLMSLLLIVFPRAFSLLSVKPSSNCGPFTMVERYTYDVFTGRVIEGVPYAVDYIFGYLLSAQTTVPLIIILVLLIVYYRVQAGQYERILHRKNGQLAMESRRGHTSFGMTSGYPVDLSKGQLGDFP